MCTPAKETRNDDDDGKLKKIGYSPFWFQLRFATR
jgi:hypothetical protein